MEKVPLFENLINLPKETRNDTINDFAAIMSVDCQVVHSLLTCYHTAREKNYGAMILDLTFGSSVYYTDDAARILDVADVREFLLADESSAVLKILHVFLSAGWDVSATKISDEHEGTRPALRLFWD